MKYPEGFLQRIVCLWIMFLGELVARDSYESVRGPGVQLIFAGKLNGLLCKRHCLVIVYGGTGDAAELGKSADLKLNARDLLRFATRQLKISVRLVISLSLVRQITALIVEFGFTLEIDLCFVEGLRAG